MAKFPNDSELHHVSGVEVPDDANHYAVKDDYARELIDILNREKSEVYITKPGSKPTSDNHHIECRFSSKEFTYNQKANPDGVGEIELASIFIDIGTSDGSVANTYTIDVSDTVWKNLDYNNINTRIAPIRVSFTYTKSNVGESSPVLITSDIIVVYSYIHDNITGSRENFFSGTGVIYTGLTTDDFMCVLVRMKLQEVDGKKQAVITVTELPKDLSGGGGSGDSFNAYVETEVLNLVKE